MPASFLIKNSFLFCSGYSIARIRAYTQILLFSLSPSLGPLLLPLFSSFCSRSMRVNARINYSQQPRSISDCNYFQPSPPPPPHPPPVASHPPSRYTNIVNYLPSELQCLLLNCTFALHNGNGGHSFLSK